MRRIHKSIQPYLRDYVVTDAEVESFMANIGSQTTYVAERRFADAPHVEWAVLADGIAVAVPAFPAATILTTSGTVKQIDNEEIWT